MRYCTVILFFWIFSLSCLTGLPALAQQRYWVQFKDKPAPASPEGNPQTRRQLADTPVHQPYLDSLAQCGIKVTGVSKWLNAAAVTASPAQVAHLKQIAFVQDMAPISGFFRPSGRSSPTPPKLLAKGVAQLQPGPLLAAGLTGKGVKIGVIDAGFYQASEKPGLQPLFAAGRIKAFKDFVNPAQTAPYTQRESYLDFHGTDVLLAIGGFDPDQQLLTGLAPHADYYLARTDHGGRENRVEEENFVRALEWLDSLGVRLVNSSLGYALGFDNPAENYRPRQMDGTSFIARAVQTAIEQKGMTIVVSAGNDGNNRNWQIIGTPADAPGTIAVGATGYSTWTRQGYSGIGPTFIPYLKPDVACFAKDGTSFSAPLITGLAACLLEMNPNLTSAQLTDILRRSGHLYPFGNNYLGYGVPHAGNALALAKAPTPPPLEKALVTAHGNAFTFKDPTFFSEGKGAIVLFRKSSPTLVLEQQTQPSFTRKIKLKRLPNETRTTLQKGRQVVEVEWVTP
ncbi:S8 family serine peptidase [Rufibacter ruber]|uniref:S8 family serine peptidase n=1 Tax=Rufibacter ruber TaxID=1783499 RepID=UPI00082B163D|nr:S8 family serine peptidase [Rufibacter ruber]